MSKLTTLITTLILGASSVAMAQPGAAYNANNQTVWGPRARPIQDRQARDRGRHDDDRRGRDDDGWRDRRVDGARRYRPSWVALNEPMQLRRGRDAIDVGVRGTFTQLRLQTTAGASYIDRVIIKFRDGGRQIAEVDRRLDVRSPMVEVQLEGNNRQIDRIIVLGDSQRDAAIQVFGI